MADDETRFIRGEEARRLLLPGQEIIENPGVVDRDAPRPTDDGIPGPSPTVENTPTSEGVTPRQERDASQEDAEAQLRRDSPEGGADGRSPDARFPADEADTGSGATYTSEKADARREQSDPTADREAEPALPGAPHFFVEQKHQVFYHDAIVYIEGEDVSDYLVGTISVVYGLGSSPNKCELKLDNAGHKFTLTPENLQQEIFRSVKTTRGLGRDFDYSESAKQGMFNRKKNPGYNPVDPLSGGRRFPLHHWSTVFHKNDSVRVWIHNPASERDEWIPVFTGYVINKPVSENYITGENTLSITCSDIRYNMEKMRVNQNSVLAVLPGQQGTQAADPTDTQPFTGLPVFTPQSNQQFNRSFFQDLTVSSTYDNPWATLRFRDLVAALTFLNNVQSLMNREGRNVEDRISATRRQTIRNLSRLISPLHQRVRAGHTLSDTDREKYNQLRSEINLQEASLGPVTSGAVASPGDVTSPSAASETEEAASAIDPSITPEDPPGTGSNGGAGGGVGAPSTDVRTSPAQPHGAGRIGRMRPGVFPWFRGAVSGEVPPDSAGSIYPSTGASSFEINLFWENWYNLCLFGSPRRRNVQKTQFAPRGPRGGRRAGLEIGVSDGPLDHSVKFRRYWTESEVHEAGSETRREGLWQTDAQAVHMILPARSAPTTDLLFEIGVISNSNVQQNLNWVTRLSLLNDACDVVDYRFWVSGSGDLIFEFAQYDFDPRDYGAYESVLTLDSHLISESFDEEAGEIVTAVVANGTYVGRGDVAEGSQLSDYAPRVVGVWSPSLASRHGLNVRVKNYPQITDRVRLNRLAMLEFQKMLAAADEYQIEIAFRPWLLLNKPIFNKYRDRYALIDGIRWTLPVTAGTVAGQQEPSLNLTLNYSRSIDEIGIPRFITGGPSQPMYFGEKRGGARNIVSSLTRRIAEFEQAINSLRSSTTPITEQDLKALREQYSAILPRGDSSYNVIDAALLPAYSEGRPEGEISETSQALAATNSMLEEVVTNAGSLSEDQTRQQLSEIESAAAETRASLRREGEEPDPSQGPGGTQPNSGASGVRSTVGPDSLYEIPPAGEPAEDASCFPGDPYMYSAPLGRQTLSVVPKFAAWSRGLRSLGDRRRREILDRFGRGGVADPFEGLTSPVGVFQYQGDFPRIVTSGFGVRNSGWHTGVDLPATKGDFVYSCADGICVQSQPSRTAGAGLAIMHAGGFVTFYRHLEERLIELGDTVKRNQEIGTVGLYSSEPSAVAKTHLHFECAAVQGSAIFEHYVGDDDEHRFSIITAPSRREILETRPDALAAADASERSSRARRRLMNSILVSGRIRGSTRIVNSLGTNRTTLPTVSAALRDRFDLGFLRSRGGSEFSLSHIYLQYNPACVGGDPFSAAEQVSSRGSSGPLITQREYFTQFGLKGIPSVRQSIIPRGRDTLDPVPEIPHSATGAARRRAKQNRDAVNRRNRRKAARLAIFEARLDREKALYRDAMPPEECPPSMYEGTADRQPGDPIPGQRRISPSAASAAYRPRRGTSGENS